MENIAALRHAINSNGIYESKIQIFPCYYALRETNESYLHLFGGRSDQFDHVLSSDAILPVNYF